MKNANWVDKVTAEEVFQLAKHMIDKAQALGFHIQSLTVPEINVGDLSVNALLCSLQQMKRVYEEMIRNHSEIQLICETHDLLTTTALTIFLTVQAVRRIKSIETGEEKVQYFVDDGRHNSFRKVPRSVRYAIVDFVRRSPQRILQSDSPCLTEVFGPSCDGDDVVINDHPLPELNNGDLIYLKNVGSDTLATRTNFNGFQNCQCHYFMHRSHLATEQWKKF